MTIRVRLLDRLHWGRYRREDVVEFACPSGCLAVEGVGRVYEIGKGVHQRGVLYTGLTLTFRRQRCEYTDRPQRVEASGRIGRMVLPGDMWDKIMAVLSSTTGVRPPVYAGVDFDAKTDTCDVLALPNVILTQCGCTMTSGEMAIVEDIHFVLDPEVVYVPTPAWWASPRA